MCRSAAVRSSLLDLYSECLEFLAFRNWQNDDEKFHRRWEYRCSSRRRRASVHSNAMQCILAEPKIEWMHIAHARTRSANRRAKYEIESYKCSLVFAEVNVHLNGKKTQIVFFLHFMHDETQSPLPRLALLFFVAAFWIQLNGRALRWEPEKGQSE